MKHDIPIRILETRPNLPVPMTLPLVDLQYKRVHPIGVITPGQPLVFVNVVALQTMRQYTASRTDIEVGGLVVGHFAIDGDIPFVRVDAALLALKAEGSEGSLRVTAEALVEMDQERERRYPDLRIVGWFHSHPGFGIFLSGTDLGTHRTAFKDGPFVALVLDPISRKEGVFGWQDEEVKGPFGYWLLEPRGKT